jgi:hypothetical protein
MAVVLKHEEVSLRRSGNRALATEPTAGPSRSSGSRSRASARRDTSSGVGGRAQLELVRIPPGSAVTIDRTSGPTRRSLRATSARRATRAGDARLPNLRSGSRSRRRSSDDRRAFHAFNPPKRRRPRPHRRAAVRSTDLLDERAAHQQSGWRRPTPARLAPSSAKTQARTTSTTTPRRSRTARSAANCTAPHEARSGASSTSATAAARGGRRPGQRVLPAALDGATQTRLNRSSASSPPVSTCPPWSRRSAGRRKA